MGSIFACGLQLCRKIILAPIFVHWFLFHFPHYMTLYNVGYTKNNNNNNNAFFPGSILSKQSFCFSKQYNQRSMHLLPGLVQENLHFCMRYFLKTTTTKKGKTVKKNYGQCFHVKSKVTCKIELIWTQKIGLNSHLSPNQTAHVPFEQGFGLVILLEGILHFKIGWAWH